MEWKGIITAMVTPFFTDETVNEKELRAQVRRQISAGVQGVFCLGTNGEFFAMSEDEKCRVIAAVVEEADGRVPVLAGTGCITTAETVRLTRKAAQLGANGVSVVSPYFAQCSQQTLLEHFTAVADASALPLLMYNMPARTGVNIDWVTARKLAEHPNIIGIKDSSGNFDNTLRYLEGIPGFTVLSGNDSLILWTLRAGGNGGISGIANIVPEVMAEIYRRWLRGDWQSAREAQDVIRPLRDCLKLGNPNSVVKRATALLGYDVGPARAPFNAQSSGLDEALRAALHAIQEWEKKEGLMK